MKECSFGSPELVARLLLIVVALFIFNSSIYSQIRITEKDLISIYGEQGKSMYSQLADYSSYNSSDVIGGSVYSILSGLSLGAYESKNFGYEWKTLPKFMKSWYNKNTSGDGIFSKSLDFNKVFRATDNIFDRLSYQKLERFYGDKWYSPILVYVHIFVIKNTSATIVRNWAKYDNPLYDFKGWTFDLEYIINRLFIEN